MTFLSEDALTRDLPVAMVWVEGDKLHIRMGADNTFDVVFESPATLRPLAVIPIEENTRAGERELCAKVAERGYQAPTNTGGGCLECGKWNPAWHKERWGHEENCKQGALEHDRDGGIAAAIRRSGKKT